MERNEVVEMRKPLAEVEAPVGAKLKVYTLKVVKLQVLPHFQLVDESGDVVNETTAAPINYYPKNFLFTLKKIVDKIEREANKQGEQIATLVKQSEDV